MLAVLVRPIRDPTQEGCFNLIIISQSCCYYRPCYLFNLNIAASGKVTLMKKVPILQIHLRIVCRTEHSVGYPRFFHNRLDIRWLDYSDVSKQINWLINQNGNPNDWADNSKATSNCKEHLRLARPNDGDQLARVASTRRAKLSHLGPSLATYEWSRLSLVTISARANFSHQQTASNQRMWLPLFSTNKN